MQCQTTKSRLTALLLAVILAFSCVITPTYAWADNKTLSDKPTWQDIYAWHIFSSTKGESADGAESITVDKLVHEWQKTKTSRYGTVDSLVEKDTINDDTARFGTIVKTLTSYGYLQTVPKSNDNPIVWLANEIFGTIAGAACTLFLNDALLGAALYDGARDIADLLRKGVLSLNVLNIFDMGHEGRNPGKLTLDQASKVSGDNAFERTVGGLLRSAGIDETLITAIATISWIVILGAFIATLAYAFYHGKQGRRQLSSAKALALRIFVILNVIPMSLMLNDVGEELTDQISTNINGSINTVDNSYVVNTLDFAAFSNFDLTLMGGTPSSNNEVDTQFYPSADNILKLNEALGAKADSTDDSNISGTTRLLQLANGDAVNVADYLAEMASGDISPRYKSVASKNTSPLTSVTAKSGDLEELDGANVSISVGARDTDPKKIDLDNSARPLWLSTKDPDYVPTEEQINSMAAVDSEIVERLKKAMESAEEALALHPDEPGMIQAAKDSKEAYEAAKKKESPDTPTYPTVGAKLVYGDEELEPTGVFKMNVIQATLSRPSTYIYGADPAGAVTEQSRQVANYVYDGGQAGSSQSYDPRTNEPFEEGTDAWKAGMKNAARIALLNRNAGTVGNGLSTQSTAFLLQTDINTASWAMSYQGYQTAPTDEGSGKNSGANGASFKRYVIPYDGPADFVFKLAQLNFVWLTAGIAALMALLALMRAPLLTALWRSASGFFRGLFTGDVFALFEYVIYFGALILCFSFVDLAISAGIWMASLLPNVIDFASGTTAGTGSAAGLTAIASIIPGSMIVMTLIVLFILTFPIIETGSMKRNGKPRKLNIISAIVMVPFLLAEAICSNFDMYRQRVYGSSGSRGIGGALKSSVKGASPGETLKKRAIGAAVGAAGVGAVALGAAGAAGMGLKGVASAASAGGTAAAAKAAAAGMPKFAQTLAKAGGSVAGGLKGATVDQARAMPGAIKGAAGAAASLFTTDPDKLRAMSSDGTLLGGLKSARAYGAMMADSSVSDNAHAVASRLMGSGGVDTAAARQNYDRALENALANDELDKDAQNEARLRDAAKPNELSTALNDVKQDTSNVTQHADNVSISSDDAQRIAEAQQIADVNAGRAHAVDKMTADGMSEERAQRLAEERITDDQAATLGKQMGDAAADAISERGMSGMLGYKDDEYAALFRAQAEANGVDVDHMSEAELAAAGRTAALNNEAVARAAAEYRSTYGDDVDINDPEYARMLAEQRSKLGLTGDNETDIANQRAAVNAGKELSVESIKTDSLDAENTDGVNGPGGVDDNAMGIDGVTQAERLADEMSKRQLETKVSNAGDIREAMPGANVSRDLPAVANIDALEVENANETRVNADSSQTDAAQSLVDASYAETNASNAEFTSGSSTSSVGDQVSYIDNSRTESNTSENYQTQATNTVASGDTVIQGGPSHIEGTVEAPGQVNAQGGGSSAPAVYSAASDRSMGTAARIDGGAAAQSRIDVQARVGEIRQQVTEQVSQHVTNQSTVNNFDNRTSTHIASQSVSNASYHAGASNSYTSSVVNNAVSSLPGQATPQQAPPVPPQAPAITGQVQGVSNVPSAQPPTVQGRR